jgi:hypothetical protein
VLNVVPRGMSFGNRCAAPGPGAFAVAHREDDFVNEESVYVRRRPLWVFAPLRHLLARQQKKPIFCSQQSIQRAWIGQVFMVGDKEELIAVFPIPARHGIRSRVAVAI